MHTCMRQTRIPFASHYDYCDHVDCFGIGVGCLLPFPFEKLWITQKRRGRHLTLNYIELCNERSFKRNEMNMRKVFCSQQQPCTLSFTLATKTEAHKTAQCSANATDSPDHFSHRHVRKVRITIIIICNLKSFLSSPYLNWHRASTFPCIYTNASAYAEEKRPMLHFRMYRYGFLCALKTIIIFRLRVALSRCVHTIVFNARMLLYSC